MFKKVNCCKGPLAQVGSNDIIVSGTDKNQDLKSRPETPVLNFKGMNVRYPCNNKCL